MLFAQILTYQVFSIAEFDFCYNFVFQSPFQQKTQLVLTNQFTFDNQKTRDLCTRTENVLFQQVNQSVFSVRIDAEFNLNAQPFSLFHYIFTNLTVVDTEINMKLTNSSYQEFAFLVATVPEYSVEIRGSSFVFETKTQISNFYGIANNLTENLVINRSTFTFICSTTISKFYGISSQVNNIMVLNSSFSITTSAATSCGFVSLVLGASTFKNLTVSGSLSGANTYGFIYENRGACTIQNIMYSLVTSGSTLNCGFVQLTSGSGTVSTLNLTFVGFTNSKLISEPASYSGTCPCITGSVLQSGLCYCAAGSLPNSNFNNCSCQITYQFIQNKVCRCPDGASPQGGVCVCTEGASLINGVCVCVTNAILTNGVCVCQPANSALQSGVCVCTPAYSTMSGNTCTCTPQYSTMQNGICTCTPAYSTLQNGVCTCTPAYTSLVSGACTCVKAGSSLVNGVCKCTHAYQCMKYPLTSNNKWSTNLGMCCTRGGGCVIEPCWRCSDGSDRKSISYTGDVVGK
ncbi:Conserved_hypothetical protein [Hexamita inflata]|uniref:Uncharacterized protein n=1 Tax=Hexamita inflata TaxID=28002 RepID=A0AA86NHG0_9EUKA|nr:Conserved hypothetical protein [Hexamita inflata]